MMTHKSATTHRGEDRAHALVLAAYHCIVEKGFEGLRLREVASQVGMDHATLHHYFPTKEALVQAVVLYVTQRLAQIAAVTEGSPVDRLRSHLHLLKVQMQEEPALFIALSEIGLRTQRDPAIRATGQQRIEEWHAFLVGILQEGIDLGDWPQDLDAEAVASAIIALVQSVRPNVGLLPSRGEQAMKQLERWLHL
ncbi:MAG TPA: TetR/AcrR family transcriptional regulator [Ktedonobacteraceae bacterium]|jgi:AcrR family transcriptional regulator|nr:TetR/AcrR family transcriptional regulator [Ktedonobacteraceae bacterium]